MTKNAHSNSSSIKHVIIVGGGAAGWLTACHLAKKHAAYSENGIKITLIESPNIPTIGVGEGTVPSIKESLRYFGISETDIIRECNATFKQSIKFVNWMKPSADNTPHSYHHIFDLSASSKFDLTPYWLNGQFAHHSYVDTVGIQGTVCDNGLAPKLMTHPEYTGATGYSYHFDAAKFSLLLTKHAVNKLGVKHIKAEINDINLACDGSISSLTTSAGDTHHADLFVDCTGFSSLLLGQKLGVKFINKNDVLFVDTAIAIQTPYSESYNEIPSYTISTAQESGWIWDIGLQDRRGTGYVYSSKHSSHQQAEQVLRDYLRQSIGEQADELPSRRIAMQVGYREQAWVKNCVGVGLSQGFVEPLEATGLLVFDDTARMLAEQLPLTQSNMAIVAKRFNQSIRHQWDKVIDFIKLHYCLSDRDDTPFWRDNRSKQSTPPTLLENLALWKERPPCDFDFVSKQDVFYRINYLYVLYGMNYKTQLLNGQHHIDQPQRAQQEFDRIRHYADKVVHSLLSNRELIDHIHQYGLQKV